MTNEIQTTAESTNVAEIKTESSKTEQNANATKIANNYYKQNTKSLYSFFLEKLPFLKEYKPLAIGVMEQIREAMWSNPQTSLIFSRALLRRMMIMHTSKVDYLNAVINGSQRYNLDGTEADVNTNGAITEREILYSKERLKEAEHYIAEAIKKAEQLKLEKQEKHKQWLLANKDKLNKFKKPSATTSFNKNRSDNEKTTTIIKAKTKQKFNFKFAEKIIEQSAEKPAIKTLNLKGKLKLKPKKDDTEK